MAKKMADNGYDCYLLSNPNNTKSADFIFAKGGKVYYTEGKLVTGKGTLDRNLHDGTSQSDRFLIDIINIRDANYISSQLKIAFQENNNLKEVMILKKGRLISVKADDVANKNFSSKFKKIWEQRK